MVGTKRYRRPRLETKMTVNGDRLFAAGLAQVGPAPD